MASSMQPLSSWNHKHKSTLTNICPSAIYPVQIPHFFIQAMEDRFCFLTLLFLVLLSPTLAFTVFIDEVEDPLIRQVVSDSDENHLLNAEHHFTAFKAKFGKTYASQEEHDYRFGVFKANLRRAKKHQMMDPTAIHGVTKFSDLTPKEFQRQFLGLKRLRLPADARKAPILPTNDLPSDFDWRDHGAVTNVKDQVHIYTPMYGCEYN